MLDWFELCPYGIWNKQKEKKEKERLAIWTLSLWDLKRLCPSSFFAFGLFELCPYGIWNLF